MGIFHDQAVGRVRRGRSDLFLDQLLTVLLEGGQPGRNELRGVRFATTRLRPGSVQPDVDGLLLEIGQATGLSALAADS